MDRSKPPCASAKASATRGAACYEFESLLPPQGDFHFGVYHKSQQVKIVILLPPHFALRDQDDNLCLQTLTSKLDINKLGLRIHKTSYTAWDIFVLLEKQIKSRGITAKRYRSLLLN